jgi:AraC family ethanolamine operon transcriptional activator
MSAHVANMEFSDADEFCAVDTGWDIEFRQLDKGPLSAKLKVLASRGVVINRLHLTRKFHQRGTAPAGLLAFGIPEFDRLHSWMRAPVGGSALLNFSRLAEYDSVSSPEFGAYTFCLDENLYRDVAYSIGLDVSVDQIRRAQGDFRLPPAALVAITRAAAEWMQYCATPGVKGRLAEYKLRDDLFMAILASIGESELPRERSISSLRQRAVDNALEYIYSTPGPILVRDLYSRSPVSWRTLDRAFLERFGVGPKKYITAVHMVGARRALASKSPDLSVADVATEWGFLHHGRFAESYYQMFGELPSATRRS